MDNPIYIALNNAGIDFNTLPEYDLGGRGGLTDYIDFLVAEEIDHPIMRGIDRYKRPFIIIKVKTTDVNGDVSYAVGTFFQRYTDDVINWAFGTCYTTNRIHNDARVRDYQYENLEKRLTMLFSGEKINTIRTTLDHSVDLTGNWIKGCGDVVVELST